MSLLKRKRWQSSKYLEFVRQQPCVCCGLVPAVDGANDAHHVIGRGFGGMGTKAPDWAVLPLCRPCHTSLHDSGADTWEASNGRQVDFALRTAGRYLEAIA